MKATLVLGLLLATACADPPKPAGPVSVPAPTPTPPPLFESLPMGTHWPSDTPASPEGPLPAARETKGTLEGAPATILATAACKDKVAGASTTVSFPAGSEDGITAAVAYGQRLEARFVREGFVDAAGGPSTLKDELFRGKAEGNYQSSFGWDETARTLSVRCVGPKCDVAVTESMKRCPNGAVLRPVSAP